MRHIENMNKVMLATGMMVSYGYVMEHFIAWYSGNRYEMDVFFKVRWAGPFAPDLLADGVLQRRRAAGVLVEEASAPTCWSPGWPSLLINIGMWCERFNIIVTALHRDFLPASWGTYAPTWVDIFLFTGTIGLFSTLFLLFLKFVPCGRGAGDQGAAARAGARGARHSRWRRFREVAQMSGGHADAGRLRPPALRPGRVPTAEALLEAPAECVEKGHRGWTPTRRTRARDREAALAWPGPRTPRS
jgi:hypothetical protein